jgi:hypothetical protein
MKLACLIICLASPALAFIHEQSPTAFRQPIVTQLARQRLNDIDLMAIENVADICMQTDELASMAQECDLEEHEALVNQLQDQRGILSEHVAYIESILAKLKGHEVEGHSLSELQL